ncbi:hypothetical protein HYW76_04120 [Candidatus Pacearchaeota archaeon]|nr:hypothetical protein [Candidatus Pacearchaeota archaeon]
MFRNENSKDYDCTINGAIFISDIRKLITDRAAIFYDIDNCTNFVASFLQLSIMGIIISRENNLMPLN